MSMGENVKRGVKAAKTRAYNEFKENLSIQREEILKWHNEIKEFHELLLIDGESGISKSTAIAEAESAIDARNISIKQMEIVLLEAKKKVIGEGQVGGIVSEIDAALVQANSKKGEIETSLEELQVAMEAVNGSEKVDGSGRSGGLLSSLNDLDGKYVESLGKNKQLISDIKDTLTSATNVRLARGFADQKDKAKHSKWIWTIWFMTTLGVIGCLGYQFYILSDKLNPLAKLLLEETVSDNGSVSIGAIFGVWFMNFLPKVIIFAPLIWFAVKSAKFQSQAARLQAEFAHKESIAITYTGHIDQIEKGTAGASATELAAALSRDLINAVAFNPSTTLEKEYHEESESIGSNLFSRFFPSKKEIE